VVSKWSREVFEEMHRGGLTAANCTCAVWENFNETIDNIAQWKSWFDEHSDLILQVHTGADIERAKATGKVGIILGWQNTHAIDGRIDYLKIFKDLGVSVMQLTYNTQNLVGSGCWESRDSGLSDFGRDVIDEMNAVGILVDLSHVGPRTTDDAIKHSRKPVAFTHCGVKALLDHPRNKTDDELRLIAEHGGFVGITTYTPFLPTGDETTVDDCLAAFEYAIDLVGEAGVGIGTDFTQGYDSDFFEWLRRDKGRGRPLMPNLGRRPPNPKGFDGMSEYPNLTAAMVRRGWPEERVRGILGGNWLRFLKEVWAA
jgi:membrane dipeptidase